MRHTPQQQQQRKIVAENYKIIAERTFESRRWFGELTWRVCVFVPKFKNPTILY